MIGVNIGFFCHLRRKGLIKMRKNSGNNSGGGGGGKKGEGEGRGGEGRGVCSIIVSHVVLLRMYFIVNFFLSVFVL